MDKKYTIRVFERRHYDASVLDSHGNYVGGTGPGFNYSKEEAMKGAMKSLTALPVSVGDAVSVTTEFFPYGQPEPDDPV